MNTNTNKEAEDAENEVNDLLDNLQKNLRKSKTLKEFDSSGYDERKKSPKKLANELVKVFRDSKLSKRDNFYEMGEVLAHLMDELDFDYGFDGNTKNQNSPNGGVVKRAMANYVGIRTDRFIPKIMTLHNYMVDKGWDGTKNYRNEYEFSMSYIPTKNNNKVIRIKNKELEFLVILLDDRGRGKVKDYRLHLRQVYSDYTKAIKKSGFNSIVKTLFRGKWDKQYTDCVDGNDWPERPHIELIKQMGFITKKDYNTFNRGEDEIRYMWYGDWRDAGYLLSAGYVSAEDDLPRSEQVDEMGHYAWKLVTEAVSHVPEQYFIQMDRDRKIEGVLFEPITTKKDILTIN